MLLHCHCGQEFDDRSERCCPRCGSIEGLSTIRWRRLYCACGHAAVRRAEFMAAICPVCKGSLVPREGEPLLEEPPASLPSEEMATVEGTAIPLRNWEAEVLLRSVGSADILRGAGILVATVLSSAWLLKESKDDWLGGLIPLVIGIGLISEGRGLFLRSETAWKVLLGFHALMLTCLGCVFANAGPRSGLGQFSLRSTELLTTVLVSMWFLPDAFAIYILYYPGRAALDLAWREEPLAPLSTIRTSGPTARTMAGLALILLSGVHAVGYVVVAIQPWLDRRP